MTNKGRPRVSDTENTVRLTVTVTESQLAFLKEYGFENASLGIRRLVDEKKQALPNEKGPA